MWICPLLLAVGLGASAYAIGADLHSFLATIFQLHQAPHAFEGKRIEIKDACLYSDLHGSVLFDCSSSLSKPLVVVEIPDALLHGEIRLAYAKSFLSLPRRLVHGRFIGIYSAPQNTLHLQQASGVYVREP